MKAVWTHRSKESFVTVGGVEAGDGGVRWGAVDSRCADLEYRKGGGGHGQEGWGHGVSYTPDLSSVHGRFVSNPIKAIKNTDIKF